LASKAVLCKIWL